MEIKQNSTLTPADILIIPFSQSPKINYHSVSKTIPELEPYLSTFAKHNDFQGRKNEIMIFYTPSPHYARIMLIGLGDKQSQPEDFRKLGGYSLKKLKKFNIHTASLYLPPKLPPEKFVVSYLEGFILGDYEFTLYQTQKPPVKHHPGLQSFTIFSPHNSKIIISNPNLLLHTCQAVKYTRDLVNIPANKLTPHDIAKEATKLSIINPNLKIQIFDEKQLAAKNLNAIIAVGKGSQHPPRLVIMEYRSPRKNAKTIALVGKGLTFDSGGISLKPLPNLFHMKCDMAGGAAVLGIFSILAQKHDLPVNVIGVIGAAENAISHLATRPGDIITSYSGKTIEITNPDAEGRLILADALAYILDQNPIAAIVDIATLTGACITALGYDITGVMTNSDSQLKKLLSVARKTDEKIWQLPLDPDFITQTKGDISDLKNYTPNLQAQAMMGGAFLSHFVGKTPWLHLDIAGTGWAETNSAYKTKGGTGAGVRLLWEYLKIV